MAKVSKYGQWKYPGEDTIIPNANGNITMKGVPYPVLGIDDMGNQQMMMPGIDYKFPGNSVYEIPMMAYGGDISIPSLKKVKIKSLPKAQLLGEISNWQKQLFNNVPTPGNLTNYTAKPTTSKSLLNELTKENNSKFAVSESTNANPILPRHWTDEAGKPRTNSQIRAIETEWQRIHDAEVAAEKEKLRRENEEYKRKQQEFAKENFGVDVSQLDNFQKYDDGSWAPKTKSLKEFEQRAKEASLENLAERRIANKKTVGEELGQVAMELPFALIGTGAYRQAFNSLRGLNKAGKILGTVDNVFQPQALNLKPGSYDDELFAYLASMEDPNIDRTFLTGLPDDQNLFYQRFGQILRQEPNAAPNQDRLRSWLEIDAAINNRLMTPPSELAITPQGIRETYTNPFQLDNLTTNNTRRYGFMDRLSRLFPSRRSGTIDLRRPGSAPAPERTGPINKSSFTKEETKNLIKDKSELDKLDKLDDNEFSGMLVTPDGKIKFPEGYTPNKNVVSVSSQEWIQDFNDNIDLLNKIIRENNTSGRGYQVIGIEGSPGISLGRTDYATLKFITDDGRVSSMNIEITPGRFRGDIDDIANADYMTYGIPGIQMKGASPIFGLPVRGTKTYESLNEYLKRLDLGRVKSGMNVQSEFSRPLWEDAIKKGKAYGFYASPGTVYGIMKQEGGDLPKAQDFGTVEEGLYKIAAYEKARGSRTGSGVSKYGNPRLKDNPTDKDAVDWMVANMLPIAKNYYTTPTEQVEAIDFIYNTGRDPRIYQLDQYLRSIGQPGLPNRGSYNIDYYGANPDSNAKTKLAELDKLWQQHGPAINKLSVNQRRQLLNKGRDFYYQNIEVKPDGSPSDAYYNTWYGRIWNTNDARPFDPKDSRFVPKRQEGGQQEDELSLLTNRNRAFQDIIVDDEIIDQEIIPKAQVIGVKKPNFNQKLNIPLQFQQAPNLADMHVNMPHNSGWGDFTTHRVPSVYDAVKSGNLSTIEESINKYLGYPMDKAYDAADRLAPEGEDPIDSFRHPTAAMYTQQAIKDKVGIPVLGDALGFLGANTSGIGHELSTLFNDERPWDVKLQEAGEDAFNNFAGSVVGLLPGTQDQKANLIYNMSLSNWLPDGVVSEDPNKNMYLKDEQGNVNRDTPIGFLNKMYNKQQGGLAKAQTTGLIESINNMYGINQEPALMDKLNSMMNPSTSKFNYARYRDAAAKYLGRDIFKGTPLTPDDIASAAQEFYNKTSYEYPLDLLLAQGQMESKLGKTLKSQHNYFNIGNTDEGAIKKFPSAKSSVLEYMNLMYNDYLDKGKKSPDDLLKPNGFVNYRGNRYASNPKYESDLAQQRAFIKKHIGL